jgi:hypothetical protein
VIVCSFSPYITYICTIMFPSAVTGDLLQVADRTEIKVFDPFAFAPAPSPLGFRRPSQARHDALEVAAGRQHAAERHFDGKRDTFSRYSTRATRTSCRLLNPCKMPTGMPVC